MFLHISVQCKINSQNAKKLEQRQPTSYISFLPLLGQCGRKQHHCSGILMERGHTFPHKCLWNGYFSIFRNNFALKERRQLKISGKILCAWQPSRSILLLLGESACKLNVRNWKREREREITGLPAGRVCTCKISDYKFCRLESIYYKWEQNQFMLNCCMVS